MKLIGNLKKTVDEIDTKDGKRDAIRKAGMLLSDNELEMVAGGTGNILRYYINNSGNGSGNNNRDDSEGSGSCNLQEN